MWNIFTTAKFNAYTDTVAARTIHHTLLFIITVAIALHLFGATAFAQSIKIGLTGPFTGGSSPMGESMRNGVRLAVEEINGIGGINGRSIELIERDDQANNELGSRIAEEMVKLKVLTTIGIVNTGVGLTSIDHYQNAKIPLMIAVSTGTALTKKYAPPAAKENYIFRVSPTIDLEAKILVADLKKKGLKQIAILADTTPYGEAGLAAFAEQCRLGGLNLLTPYRFKVGETDMSMQLQKAKLAGAQALIAWGIGPELAAIARGIQVMNWKIPLMGSWTFSMRNFIDGAGQASEGALMPQTFIQDAGSTAKNSFLLSYRRSFKTDLISSPMSAAQGYDGMHLLALAMRQASSIDSSAIRAALDDLKQRYQGVITSYEKPFHPNDHDAITQNMMVMGKVISGRVDYAYQDDLQRSSLMRIKQKAN